MSYWCLHLQDLVYPRKHIMCMSCLYPVSVPIIHSLSSQFDASILILRCKDRPDGHTSVASHPHYHASRKTSYSSTSTCVLWLGMDHDALLLFMHRKQRWSLFGNLCNSVKPFVCRLKEPFNHVQHNIFSHMCIMFLLVIIKITII